jgi:hypothetical protein
MPLIVKVRNLFQACFLKIRLPNGSITPIMMWPHYADHQLASLRRSWGGTITAIINWLVYGDHGMAL